MKKIKDETKSFGGKARAAALTSDQRKEIAKKAAEKRWGTNLPQATHEGELTIGEEIVPCYVLEDGQRILSTRGIMKALGRAWRGRKYSGTELPVFLEAKNLNPFIANNLSLVPTEFKTDKGMLSEGFPAETLPAVCEVYLKAREMGVLTTQQLVVAHQCEIIVRALSSIGIVALVDEATGYQEVRDRQALQKILDKYLSEEKAKWAKTFPDEFYKKMFRLKGWEFNPLSVKRPGVIGHYTNDIIYQRLAPGILKKLQELNPKTDKGNRKNKHFQYFTDDYGLPELKEHLTKVMFLMDASGNDWDLFKSLLNRASPKQGNSLELELSVNYDD